MSQWRLRRVCHAIKRGAVIAYPTDTIWGFGCHPMKSQAIQRLLSIKQRPLHKGLILLSGQLDFCHPYIDEQVYNEFQDRLSQPTTNPRTWIVPASNLCPVWLTGNSPSIAIRITDKPLVMHLSSELQSPLVSTSANMAGRRHARNRLLIERHFGTRVDFILEDTEQHSQLNVPGSPSEIIDLQTGKILRA